MPLTEANRIPTATFRVQLNAEFTFRQLEAQVGYLRSLGISDFYLSPIFTAQPGSTHGYDVNDYTRISDELGGSAAFERLADQVKEQGGGLLVDLVPNHMGIAGDGNAWWQEVLEFGPASDYAPFFDIDWQAAGGRVLLSRSLSIATAGSWRPANSPFASPGRDWAWVMARSGCRCGLPPRRKFFGLWLEFPS